MFTKPCPSRVGIVVLSAACAVAVSGEAQTLLFDLGNDSSFRGADVTSPDVNGNHWNSVWSGAFYSNVVDVTGAPTSINFGFSSAVGNDSFNGPAGDTAVNSPADSVYNAAALGDLGIDEAVYDYYVNSSFQIQQLDPTKTYDLTFYGSHKFNNDDVTRYSIYSDATQSSVVASGELLVGSGPNHNQDTVLTISGVTPQAGNTLYVGFEGANGGNGYLNALKVSAATPPPEPSRPKLYMHYMPWFNTPETLGAGNWGLHWRQTRGVATDPHIVDATGKRQIPSKFYPKIGPYQSGNEAVTEYHLLLMKLAGIDGVLIDWYGVEGANGDVASLLTNSNAIVNQVAHYGMAFGVVLEDRFSTVGINGPADITKAEANLAYLRDNYFNRPEYIRTAASDDPLLPIFGPITFEQEAQWTQILASAGEDVEFLPLWYESGDAGANADGEYSWVFEDENRDDHLARLEEFYVNRAPTLGTVGASAYPGFDVFGGANFQIPHDNGQTLAQTLALAQQYEDEYDFLQLVTWNDFGEGTVFEPTIETGFSYLVQLQQYTGVPFDEADLELVYRLYLARQEYAGNAAKQAELDAVSASINALQLEQAETLLNTAAPAGDYDGDGEVTLLDWATWAVEFGSETVLHGSGADGNRDGVIDIADYTVWRDSFTPSSPGVTVPEPATLPMVAAAAAYLMQGRRVATPSLTACTP